MPSIRAAGFHPAKGTICHRARLDLFVYSLAGKISLPPAEGWEGAEGGGLLPTFSRVAKGAGGIHQTGHYEKLSFGCAEVVGEGWGWARWTLVVRSAARWGSDTVSSGWK